MAKTREVYQVRVYFSKEEYLEWKDVKDVDYDEGYVEFTYQDNQKITVYASRQVIVVTRREEVIAQY